MTVARTAFESTPRVSALAAESLPTGLVAGEHASLGLRVLLVCQRAARACSSASETRRAEMSATRAAVDLLAVDAARRLSHQSVMRVRVSATIVESPPSGNSRSVCRRVSWLMLRRARR